MDNIDENKSVVPQQDQCATDISLQSIAYKHDARKRALVADIAYGLKIFNINKKNALQKSLGDLFIAFIKIFDVPLSNDQSFNFARLGHKKMRRFCTRFLNICEEFLSLQTEPAKAGFINQIIVQLRPYCCLVHTGAANRGS